MILYNLRIDGDHYRITKFDDGNPVSSYLCTETECDCPAGVRPTCRHRQMLPHMLSICNTEWFMAWDTTKAIVDFQGNPRPRVTKPAAEGPPAMPEGITVIGLDDPELLFNTIADAVGEPRIAPTPTPKPFRRRI